MFRQKGAMFGLDARIALAIFGALSVISGAALYSAIQQSKLVSLSAEMNEIAKAVEAYMLDTGQDLILSGTVYDVNELVTSSVVGWQGPYVQYEVGTTFDSGVDGLLDDSYHSYLIRAINESWAADDAKLPCESGKTCHLWINVRKVPKSLAQKYDEYIDGSVDPNAGNVRTRTGSDSNYLYLYQRYFPVLKQL